MAPCGQPRNHAGRPPRARLTGGRWGRIAFVALDPKDVAARRAARAAWPIAVYKLGSEPSDDLSDVTTAAERVAMMAELAESAWRLAGRPMPVYDRRTIPGRVLRPGSARSDDDDS